MGEHELSLLEIAISQIESYLPKYSILNDNLDSLTIINKHNDREEEALIKEIIDIIATCREDRKRKTFEDIFLVEGYQVLFKRKEEIRRRIFDHE